MSSEAFFSRVLCEVGCLPLSLRSSETLDVGLLGGYKQVGMMATYYFVALLLCLLIYIRAYDPGGKTERMQCLK